MANPIQTSPQTQAAPRRRWVGPFIIAASAVIGLVAFGGLAIYRIRNGWSSEVVDVDRDVIVAVGDLKSVLDDVPVRLDLESWSKIWKPGNRCEITYAYDHPDLNQPLILRSHAFKFRTRQESFREYQRLSKELRAEFGELAPEGVYLARDNELTMNDQSQFGSFNVADRPIAYFFARRRGVNVYIGFIRSDDLDDGSLGEVFAPPIDHLDDWEPSQ